MDIQTGRARSLGRPRKDSWTNQSTTTTLYKRCSEYDDNNNGNDNNDGDDGDFVDNIDADCFSTFFSIC